MELVLLGTTDVHGRVYPYDYYTGQPTDHGLTLLKPLVDSIRAANPGRVYLFDSGDLLQGTLLAYLYARVRSQEPSPIVRAMNLMGYSASAIGNHEFNYGLEYLGRAVAQAAFPLVTANVYRHGTGEHAYRPYVLLPHPVAGGDTIRLGVTGVTPPGVHIWDRRHVEGVLDFRDAVASLRPVVAEMRARGADLVVVLSHGGFGPTSYETVSTGLARENAAREIAREVAGVDVVFLGHTHREIADTTINGVLLTQARNWAESLAVVTVRLEREPGSPRGEAAWGKGGSPRGGAAREGQPGAWRVAAKRAAILRPRRERADTALLDSLRREHERAAVFARSVIGRSTEAMDARAARVRDTPILDFVNEVQRRVAGADLSSTAAFRLAARIPQGDVTIGDIGGLYIYDNQLLAVRITGAQLRAYLEKTAEYYRGWPLPASGDSLGTVTNFQIPGYNFDIVSGVDYTIDLSRPVGDRIVGLSYHGAPVQPDQTFTLALNNYRQAGGGGYSMLAGLPLVYSELKDIRELLIDEVRRRGTIQPADYFRENWRILPPEAVRVAAAEQSPFEDDGRAGRAAAGPAAAGAAAADAAAAARPRLRVLATSDLHGWLEPTLPSWSGGRPVGGAATLAAYFREERAGFGGPTLLVDGGDVMQGGPVSSLTRGEAAVAFYNAAGYHAVALGNHDLDWGQEVLRERLKQARFHWLAANVFVAGADTAPSWIRPTALVEVDGVRVGVIGLAHERTPSMSHADDVAGLEFRSAAAAVDRWVPELRRRGVAFVIVVSHLGANCDAGFDACAGEVIETARNIRQRPDLVIAGHAHRIIRTRVNGIPIVEPGWAGARYAVVDLERVSADSVSVWVRDFPTTYSDRVAPDSAVAALVARYQREVGPRLEQVMATVAERLPYRSGGGGGRPGQYAETALGRLIADAQRAATGTQVAIINNGGIRTDVDAGPLTWGELFAVLPFQNQLVRLRITGAQLRAVMEHALRMLPEIDLNVSGVTVEYDPRQPVGQRVVRLVLDGEVVRDDATYWLGAPDFLAGRGDGYTPLGDALVQENTGIVDLDAVADYLRRLPQPVRAPTAPRFRAIPSHTANP